MASRIDPRSAAGIVTRDMLFARFQVSDGTLTGTGDLQINILPATGPIDNGPATTTALLNAQSRGQSALSRRARPETGPHRPGGDARCRIGQSGDDGD
jgi:hypothetical protein